MSPVSGEVLAVNSGLSDDSSKVRPNSWRAGGQGGRSAVPSIAAGRLLVGGAWAALSALAVHYDEFCASEGGSTRGLLCPSCRPLALPTHGPPTARPSAPAHRSTATPLARAG